MIRNRKIALLLVAIMLVSVLAACGGGSKPAEEKPAEGQEAATSSAPQNIILATGGTTGTYYSLGGTIAQLFNSKIEGMNVTAQSTGASIENCRLLGDGEAEIALLQNDILDYAYNGTEAFEGTADDSLRAVASLYPEVIHIVANESITSIADLAGKKVSVGAAGSGTEANARQILGEAGITYDDIKPNYLSFSESADAFKDGQIDAFFVTAGVPNASIQDITAQHKINILAVESDISSKLLEDYPFYIEFTIPGGTYAGVEEDVNTVAVLAVLATGADQPEETIHNLTKTLYENLEELAGSHAKGAEIKLEKATDGISIPFHPGAEKYYKEAGIL